MAPGIWESPACRAYLLTTDDGRVVVNTGMGFESPSIGPFRRRRQLPTRYIILTQGHYDHVGGLDVMRDPGTKVVAQANWRLWRDDNERLAVFRARNSAFAFADALTRGIKNHPGTRGRSATGPVRRDRRRRGRRHPHPERGRPHDRAAGHAGR